MSNALAVIALVNDIVTLIANGTTALQSIHGTLQKANDEGRDVTTEELDALRQVRLQIVDDMKAEVARRSAAGGA